MITIDDVIDAKNDDKKYKSIYERIFYSHGEPKLRKWLVNRGVHYSELDEVESIMAFTFVLAVDKYNHDKIPFDKYVWIHFKNVLLNYFFRKNNILKMSKESSLEEKVENGFDIAVNCSFDFSIDYGFLLNHLTSLQCAIFKLKKDGMNDFEIISKLNIDEEIYYEERYKLEDVLCDYIDGNL